MKKKFLALAFVGGNYEYRSVACPAGFDGLGYGGWSAIVCSAADFYFYMNYYCPENPVGQ